MFGADVLYLFGMSYLQLGEFQKAKQVFEDVIQRYPESTQHDRAMIGIASTFYYTGNYVRAIEQYEKIPKKS